MKVVVVLHLSQVPAEVFAFAGHVLDCMTENPLFPSPEPALDRVRADLAAATTAHAAVLTRAKGKREARDVELDVLCRDLRRLSHYVQDVADDNPAEAAGIVTSAGMFVKRPSIRTVSPFKAARGPVSGSAVLTAKSAGDRAAYQWRYSTDAATWTPAPHTNRSRTVIHGLTPATTYYFQFRVLTIHGMSDWSDVVALVVE